MPKRSRRTSRAYSVASDDAAATRQRSAAPTLRSGTRGVRAQTATAEAAPLAEVSQPTRIPPHYELAPTFPSPFNGTLEDSLEAILQWGRLHTATTTVKEKLLGDVSPSTNWPALLTSAFGPESGIDSTIARFLLEEFVFLVIRTLFPEQIAENRAAMARLYDRKKHLAIRLVLRYDMLREWCLGSGPVGKRDISIPSIPPPEDSAISSKCGSPVNGSTADEADETVYQRRRLMPNIWPTLIAAPRGGFGTQGVRERMKHYVTPLDDHLLLSDEVVSDWGDTTLIVRASQLVLQWQWLRQQNKILEDMEVNDWEELAGKAEDCVWIADKRDGPTVKGRKNSEEP